MKLYKYIIVIAALLLTITESNAQQTIDPTLEVNRNFDAKLLEITKGKLYTNFDDSLGRFNLSFNYTIFDKPIKDLYEFSPLSSAQIEKSAMPVRPFLFIKAGSNIPFNPYGSIYIQPRLGNNFSLVINGSHNSFLAKLPAHYIETNMVDRGETKVAAPSSKTDLGIDFKYHWEKGELGLKAGHNNKMNSYYGFDQRIINIAELEPILGNYSNNSFMRDSMSHTTNITGAGFYAKSLNKNPNSFYYNAQFSYSKLFENEYHPYYIVRAEPLLPGNPPFLGDQAFANNKLDEQYLNLSLTAGAGFANFNKILAGVKYEASDSRFSDSLNRSNLELHPRYIFKKGKWSFDLGFKYNMWWEQGSTDYNIYFSSSTQLEIVNNKFWLYGFIDGKNNFMNYHKMAEMNSWISPATQIRNIEQPVVARVGIKGNVKEKLSYNIYGGYYEYRNQLYFYSLQENFYSSDSPMNGYQAMYKDEKRVGFGAEVSFHSKSFEGVLTTDFYTFKDNIKMTNTHFNYSPSELKVLGRYNWRERVIVNGSFTYKQKTPRLIDMYFIDFNYDLYDLSNYSPIYTPSYAKLDVSISYVYNKNLTFFIQLNNILDSKVFEYVTYAMPGFNGGVGLSFKL